jgi:hypothetical protein
MGWLMNPCWSSMNLMSGLQQYFMCKTARKEKKGTHEKEGNQKLQKWLINEMM